MKVLLTNDDGIHSPFLPHLIPALKSQPWCEELRVVVPAENQSWIAQAHTRKGPVFVESHPCASHDCFVVAGTPADCSALGIANLYRDLPDLVISGINLGLNSGRAWFNFSGTVGGAQAASLFEIPAIAISSEVPQEVFTHWTACEYRELRQYDAPFSAITERSVSLVECLYAQLKKKLVDLYSVNVPWNVKPEAELKFTYIQPSYFSSLFEKIAPNAYRHKMAPFKKRDIPIDEKCIMGDIVATDKGYISVTPISHRLPVNELVRLAALHHTGE